MYDLYNPISGRCYILRAYFDQKDLTYDIEKMTYKFMDSILEYMNNYIGKKDLEYYYILNEFENLINEYEDDYDKSSQRLNNLIDYINKKIYIIYIIEKNIDNI